MASLPATETLALREAMRTEALKIGFARAGFTTADPLPGAVQRRWERWLARDVAGDMHYLKRPLPRRTHPRDLLPEAQSIFVGWAPYSSTPHPPPPTDEGACGKIARYAWGRDYHQVLREKLQELAIWLNQQLHPAPLTWRACVDSAPLDERALAIRAGIGFVGKNTLVIDPACGSFGFLCVLLISLDIPPDGLSGQQTASCGNCRRCLDACPTDALAGPYQLDPRRCISYLTIEHRGQWDPELSQKMSSWAFGCDICQEVCPYNIDQQVLPWPEFGPDQGVGHYLTENHLKMIRSGKLLLKRLGHTPLIRPRLRGLWRNLQMTESKRLNNLS